MIELDAAIAEESAAAKACEQSSALCKRLDEQQRGWLLRRENAMRDHMRNLMQLDRAKETRKRMERESCMTTG
jgi:hypothetical protein